MDRAGIEALVRRWAEEAVAEGRVEVFDAILAEDAVDTSGEAPSRGRETFKARARALAAALGDRRVVVDAVIVEGDRVAWRWTLTGTHVGPLLEVAPTQRRVTLRGVNHQRVEDGRVVEHWTLADLAGLARQLRAPA